MAVTEKIPASGLIEKFPGGGFVLHAVDQVTAETPWRNVEAMIRTWRRLGTYPIASGG